jgi:predicted transcriptional regulator
VILPQRVQKKIAVARRALNDERIWRRMRQLAGDLLDRAFSGSAKALLVGALSARKATKQELAELRQLLEKHSKEAK